MGAVAIVPAAGRGERFGTPLKLLVDIDGEPLLARTIRSLLDGGVSRVIVVTSPEAPLKSVAVLTHPAVVVVTNPDPSRGMLSSIQSGIAAADGDPMLILPGDMPYVQPQTIAAVIAASRQGDVVTPIFRTRRGHPVSIPSRLRDEILEADPASTLSAVLQRHEDIRLAVDVDDPGVLRDVDTRADML